MRVPGEEYAALWGRDRHWQAVSFDGRVLRQRLTESLDGASVVEALV